MAEDQAKEEGLIDRVIQLAKQYDCIDKVMVCEGCEPVRENLITRFENLIEWLMIKLRFLSKPQTPGIHRHLVISDYLDDGFEAELAMLIDQYRHRHRLPFNAGYILHLLIGKEEIEIISGDLIEIFNINQARFGKGYALRQFFQQFIYSVWPLLQRRIIKAASLVLRRAWWRRFIR